MMSYSWWQQNLSNCSPLGTRTTSLLSLDSGYFSIANRCREQFVESFLSLSSVNPLVLCHLDDALFNAPFKIKR